jgi:CTP synthase (UTP-ammonia lyase)
LTYTKPIDNVVVINFNREVDVKQGTKQEIKIGVIGDYNAVLRAHDATNDALQHAANALHTEVSIHWLPTPSLEGEVITNLGSYSALWIAPGSPYANMEGVLHSIRFAREQQIPLLGTCGGFQHMVIEYARNVMSFQDAQHAEYDPFASTLFITALACSLLDKTMEVHIEPNTKTATYYSVPTVQEEYYCNFGLNPLYRSALHEQGLRVVGVDQDGEARILELPTHPFFVATLFVPQLTSSWEKPHPLIVSYLRAALTQPERQLS